MRHIYVHSGIYTKLSKPMAFEKSVLSTVVYGLYFTCVTAITFNIHARHAHCLVAMYHNVYKCENLAFLTQIHLHKQYIFDTNIIQSEYGLFFLSVYLK